DARRRQDALAGERPGVQGTVGWPHGLGALRAVLLADAARIAVGYPVSRRRRERLREAVLGADAAHAAVPRSAPARNRDQGRPGAPEGRSETATSDRTGARSDVAAATGEHPVPLQIERADQNVSRPSLPAGVCAGRSVSAGVCAGVRRGPDVRGRTAAGALAPRGALHANRGSAGYRVSTLARCPLGPARTRGDRVSACRRGLRPLARVARLPVIAG